MKQYIKAEWELYKKNYYLLIAGGAAVFLYGLFLMFSGIMEQIHVAVSAMIGIIALLFFLIPMYFSPVHFLQNRKKQNVAAEKMVLALGESKRIFLQVRLLGWGVLYFGIVLFTAVMQLPALLIARGSYRLSGFAIELCVLSAFFFASLIPPCLVSCRSLLKVWSVWIGVQCGILGGYFSDGGVEEESMVRVLAVWALFWFVIAAVSFLFRYCRTVREERGGKEKKRR